MKTKTADNLQTRINDFWNAITSEPAPTIEYQTPGRGAIEFAREHVIDHPRADAMSIVQRLMDGELHDKDDKRVKRCAYCRYYYRDRTRPNNSVVCSPECRDERRKANQRQAHTPKPKKPTSRELYYYDHHEYPFWLNEYEMLKQSWRHDMPYEPEKVQQIHTSRERREAEGGTRKRSEMIGYNGDEESGEGIRVKFSDYGQRKPGEVSSRRMTREEIEAEMLAKYGAYRMRAERRRARIEGRGLAVR